MKKIKFKIEYILYVTLETFVSYMPDFLLKLMSKVFAIMAFSLLRIRRNVALQNLKIAFPAKPYSWHKKIAFLSYSHFALVILEFMKMNSWTIDDLIKRVKIDKEDRLIKAYQKGERIILLSGHFGNWELAMGYISKFGQITAVIQQRQKNLLVNNRMKELRQKWAMEIIYPRGAVEKCAEALSDDKNIGILGDQDGGRKGIFISFFNRPASTHPGVALLHLKTGVPIYFFACILKNDHKIQLETKCLPQFEKGEISKEKIEIILTKYMEILEEYVRQFPEQYFWMHKRWKTKSV